MENSSMNREEAVHLYEAALKRGKRFYSEYGEPKGLLSALTPEIKGISMAGELQIGLREIPLKKVVGTYAPGRSAAFAGNFMPLLDQTSEFGEKWISLCASHLSTGIHDPIKVYEYLGYYYVVEGNKRVSVLKSVGAYAVSAEVTRIIPTRSEDKKIQLYYEKLDFDKTRILDEMWFTELGRFPWLIEHAKIFARKKQSVEKDENLEWMFECYRDFARRYREHPETQKLKSTTADAFYRYVQLYGFPVGEDYSVLADRVAHFIPEVKMMETTEEELRSRVESTLKENEEKTWAALLGFKKKTTPVMGFVLVPPIGRRGWCMTHCVAVEELRRRMGKEMTMLLHWPTGEQTSEQVMQEMIDQRAGVVFATAMNQREEALRICLKNTGVPVLCCSPLLEKNSLSTYNARFYEGTFLAGALAGLMTEHGKIGLVSKAPDSWLRPCDYNAYAEGARLTNPRVQVKLIYLKSGDLQRNAEESRWRLYEQGVDVMLTGAVLDGPVRNRLPAQTVMSLCKLGEQARIEEYYGALTLSWTRFYRKFAQQIIEGKLDTYKPGDPIHYRWGIQEGLVDLLIADQIVGEYPARLVRFFREMVCRGEIQIFHDFPVSFRFADVMEKTELLPWIETIAEDFPER